MSEEKLPFDGQQSGVSQEAREDLRTEFVSLGGIVTSLPDVSEVRDFTQVYIPGTDRDGKQLFDMWQMLDGKWFHFGQVGQKNIYASGNVGQFDTDQTITIGNQNEPFTEILLGWTINDLENIIFASGAYTIQRTGKYLIIWSLSVKPAANSISCEFGIAKNGAKINNGWTQDFLNSTTNEETTGSSTTLNLKTGDKITLAVINETDSNNIAIQHASFTIMKIR